MNSHGVPRQFGGGTRRDELHVVDVIDACDGGVFGWGGGVDRVHDRQPGGDDVVAAGAVEREADVVEVDHRVEVAAEGHGAGHVTEPLDGDAGVEPLGEAWHVGQCHRHRATLVDLYLGDDEASGCVEPDNGA